MIPALAHVLRRELDTLERELRLYPDDASLWVSVPGQTTAGGNLALHLAGNLRHFIGATLGATGYVREREREFSSTGLSREAIIEEVRRATQDVEATLKALDPSRLAATYPLEIQGIRLGTEAVLLHLASHLAFHLGQVDYHRRAVTGDRTSAGPLALAALEP
jgi:hypothetical protein